MQDAFFDETVRDVTRKYKIIEVMVHEDKSKGTAQEPVVPRKQPTSDVDSDEAAISATEDEMLKIREDIKAIKAILRLIRKKTEQLDIGCRGWFLHFDKDNSDAIELNEFV